MGLEQQGPFGCIIYSSPPMDSLEFGNLPLIEVTCNLVLAEQRAFAWDDIAAVRAALKDRLPIVSDFFSGRIPSPVGFVFGTAPGAAFESDMGAKVEVRPDRLTSSWRRLGPDSNYVRFKQLFDALQIATDALGSPAVSIVNMVYVNRAPHEQGSFRDLLRSDLFPEIVAKEVKDYNVAWLLESEVEFRLQVSPEDQLAVLSTAAGLWSSGDWQAELKLVHETLQTQFLAVITQHAKEVWKWKQS